MLTALVGRVRARELEPFVAQGERCGWCRHPVRLRGYVRDLDAGTTAGALAFSSLALPDGVVLKACGSRKETRCPSCARVYRGDARHLVRAGLVGGKGVDASIASHPAVFLTLTAPSFGPVHRSRPEDGTCRPTNGDRRCAHGRPLACRRRHDEDDDAVGTPLCPDCYDYEGAVLHNGLTPELWRRTTVYVPRQLAAVVGTTQAALRRSVRLSFLRVAELQRRGVVHLHAVVRADAVDGGLPALDAAQLALACLAGARSVTVPHRHGVARWGEQLDAQVLEGDQARARRVGAYVAKYATKSSDAAGGLDRPITSGDDLAARGLPPHTERLAARRRPGPGRARPSAPRPHLRLRRPLPLQVAAVLDHLRGPAPGPGPVAGVAPRRRPRRRRHDGGPVVGGGHRVGQPGRGPLRREPPADPGRRGAGGQRGPVLAPVPAGRERGTRRRRLTTTAGRPFREATGPLPGRAPRPRPRTTGPRGRRGRTVRR